MRSRASVPVLLALLFAACGQADVGTLTVTNAWVRSTAAADQPSAGYLTIVNETAGPVKLTGVASSAADVVELHRTTTDSMGMTAMNQVSEINIPAGGTVTLEPGGFHLMLMGLKTPLVAGGPAVPLTLNFTSVGPITVNADVRAITP